MIKTPAFHQTDPEKAPGQIVNPITLGDYINSKYKQEAFKTDNMEEFDTWFKKYNQENGLPPAYEVAKAAWNAAKGYK